METEETGEGEEMNARVGTTTSAFIATIDGREPERPRRSLVLAGEMDEPVPAPVLSIPVIGL